MLNSLPTDERTAIAGEFDAHATKTLPPPSPSSCEGGASSVVHVWVTGGRCGEEGGDELSTACAGVGCGGGGRVS